MGVETNGAPAQEKTAAESLELPIAVGGLGEEVSGGLSASQDPCDSPASLATTFHRRDDVLSLKTEQNLNDDTRDVLFPDRISAPGDNYLITASESSATNRKYNASLTPPPPSSAPLLSCGRNTSAADNHYTLPEVSSSAGAKFFRFSGDFSTLSCRNSSVLSAFASSMGNLSDAWDDVGKATELKGAKPSLSRFSPSSSNSVLAELPTRFSFESSSTTSSSSSHLSLLQKPTAPRKFYQRNHGGSFDRKDLQPSLSAFQSQCEDFESYISTQINRYGSVEKLMNRPHDDPNKSALTDLSSLSLSPINRRRDLLGPAISL